MSELIDDVRVALGGAFLGMAIAGCCGVGNAEQAVAAFVGWLVAFSILRHEREVEHG